MSLIKHVRILTLTTISAGLIGGFLFVNFGNKVKNTFLASASYSETAPTPTVSASTKEEVVSSNSPDGKKTLTLKKLRDGNLTTYSLFSDDIPPQSTPPGILLFDKTSDVASISIPYNTWAPDNAYLFLQEESQNSSNYYVFASTGKPFASGEHYLSISDLFAKSRPEFTLTEVTGWAAPYLLIVNTKTADGDQGRSFWFDVASRSFIQLSTLFN